MLRSLCSLVLLLIFSACSIGEKLKGTSDSKNNKPEQAATPGNDPSKPDPGKAAALDLVSTDPHSCAKDSSIGALTTWSTLPIPASVGLQTLGNAALVWTGTKILAWDTNAQKGMRIDPLTGDIQPMASTGYAGDRMGLTDTSVVCAGGKLLIWGGSVRDNSYGDDVSASKSVGDGAVYDPEQNAWTMMASDGAPSRRSAAVALSTGTEMIIFGGTQDSDHGSNKAFPDAAHGAIFDPNKNQWRPINSAGAPPSGAYFYKGVWTGSRMIVWGLGWDEVTSDRGSPHQVGGIYDPATDTWSSLTLGLPLSFDSNHNAGVPGDAFWVASQMLLWDSVELNYAFSPTTQAWSESLVTGSGYPIRGKPIQSQAAGTKLIFWGGDDPNDGTVAQWQSTGGIYDFAAKTWTTLPTEGGPYALASNLWAGDRLVVFPGPNKTEERGKIFVLH